MSMATVSTTPDGTMADTGGDDEFDLDIRLVEYGPVISELQRITSDNCGGTCASACVSCGA